LFFLGLLFAYFRVSLHSVTSCPRHFRAHRSASRRRRPKVGFWRSVQPPPGADAVSTPHNGTNLLKSQSYTRKQKR
jgi:hypothetical protein